MIHSFVNVYKMSKKGIKVDYVIALVQFAFGLILSCIDCASLTLEAIILPHFIFRCLLKIGIINEIMFI